MTSYAPNTPTSSCCASPAASTSHAPTTSAHSAASGELLLFLNNDTEALEPGWLDDLAGWASRAGVGVVGAKLLRANGLIQHAGIVMGLAGHGSHIFEDTPEDTYGVFGSTEWYRTYHAVTGACMMVPAELFHDLGGFDEIYQIGYSDIEFCLRAAQAGYRTVYTPFARLLHNEGSSRGFYVPPSDVLRASCQMLPLSVRATATSTPTSPLASASLPLPAPTNRTRSSPSLKSCAPIGTCRPICPALRRRSKTWSWRSLSPGLRPMHRDRLPRWTGCRY